MTDIDKVWQRNKLARSTDRPKSAILIKEIFPDL